MNCCSKIKNLLTLLTLAVVCFAGKELLNAAEQADDAATFVGRSDIYKRYLRLGELALENEDAAAAAEFFVQSLRGLEDAALRRQASDLLLECLLISGKNSAAEKLYAECSVSPEFAGDKAALELMQGRLLMHTNKSREAIRIFTALAGKLPKDDPKLFRALELLGKSYSSSGDYAPARAAYIRLAAVAGDNGLWEFKALEGLIFLELANNDLAAAEQAWKQMENAVPEKLRSEFKSRIDKLWWLIECHGGNSRKVEADFLKAAAKSKSPDPLIARIAYTIAGEADEDWKRSVKFARMAVEFAEGAFRENAMRGVVELELARELWSEALADCSKYLQMFPQSKDYCAMKALQGELFNKLDRIPEAVTAYRELFENQAVPLKTRLDAAVSLAHLYQKSEQPAAALAMFKFAAGGEPDPEKKALLYQEMGEYLYQLGRYNEALNSFAEAVKDKKSADKAYLWQAQSLYQLKKFEAAQKMAAQAVKSSDPQLRCKAGYLNTLLAEQLLPAEKALALTLEFAGKYPKQPEGAGALFQSGMLAMKVNAGRAGEIFRQYAKLYPGEKAANALYRAIGAALLQNDEKGAVGILKALDQNYPDSRFTVGAHSQMVDFLRENGRFEDAVRKLDEVARRCSGKYPELIPETLFDRAVLYGKLKDSEKMQQALDSLLQQYADQPIAPQAFFLLGNLKMEQGKYEEAFNAFNQARERSTGGVFNFGCAGRAADAAYSLYTQSRLEPHLRQAREGVVAGVNKLLSVMNKKAKREER